MGLEQSKEAIAQKLASSSGWNPPVDERQEAETLANAAKNKPESKEEAPKQEVEATNEASRNEAPKSETPKQEDKQTPSNEGGKPAEEKAAPTTDDSKNEDTVDWQARFKEIEAKYKEAEEKVSKLSDEPKEPQYANEYIKKLDELAKGGVELNDEFWRMQSLDLEKYDSSNKSDNLALKRLELKVFDKDLSDAHVDRILKRNYPALFDESIEPDDQEYKDALLDLEIDAKRARTKLGEHKQKIQLPKVDLSKKEEQEAQARKAQEQFINDVKTQVSSYQEQPFKVGDVELKYSVNDEAKKEVESMIINNQTFFNDNYVKEGTVDYGRLKRDLLLIANQDKIMKMWYDQGVSAGKSSIADELENAEGTATGAKSESKEFDWVEAARQKVKERR